METLARDLISSRKEPTKAIVNTMLNAQIAYIDADNGQFLAEERMLQTPKPKNANNKSMDVAHGLGLGAYPYFRHTNIINHVLGENGCTTVKDYDYAEKDYHNDEKDDENDYHSRCCEKLGVCVLF